MKYTLLGFSLSLLISVVINGESVTAADRIGSNNDEEAAVKVTQPTVASIAKLEEPTPQAEDPQETTSGDSLRNFIPSELISTDNAVPFPVDI